MRFFLILLKQKNLHGIRHKAFFFSFLFLSFAADTGQDRAACTFSATVKNE